MTKRYALALVLLLGLPALLSSQNLIPSLTLYDLTASKMNTAHVDSKGNIIKISTNEPTGTTRGSFEYKADLDENPLECSGEAPAGLEPPAGDYYSRILLVGKGTNKPPFSPYFIIDFGSPTTGIREIQLMGKATGISEGDEGELLYAFSTTTGALPAANGNGDFDDLPEDKDGSGQYVYKPLVFKTGDCNYDKLRIRLPEGTVCVILIATSNFGGWSMSEDGFPNSPAIHAIRFYTEDNGTDIVKEAMPANHEFAVRKEGRRIIASEYCDINVYDSSGRLSLSGKGVNELILGEEYKGVYIINAVSKKSGDALRDKILLR